MPRWAARAAACSTRPPAPAATSFTAALLPDASHLGPAGGLLQPHRRPDQGGHRARRLVLPTLRRRHWRTARAEPHLLLGGDGGLSSEGDDQGGAAVAECPAEDRRFLDDHRRRISCSDLQPLLSLWRRQCSVPCHRPERNAGQSRVRQRDHPRVRAQSRRRQHAGGLAAPEPEQRGYRPKLHRQPGNDRPRRHVHAQDRAQADGRLVDERHVSVQQDHRAGRPGHGRRHRRRARSWLRQAATTTASARRQQYEHPRRFDRPDLTVRLDQIPG